MCASDWLSAAAGGSLQGANFRQTLWAFSAKLPAWESSGSTKRLLTLIFGESGWHASRHSSARVAAGATAPTAVKIYNAAAATGRGPADVTLGVQLAVPGNAYSGSYSSTWTFTIASGP